MDNSRADTRRRANANPDWNTKATFALNLPSGGGSGWGKTFKDALTNQGAHGGNSEMESREEDSNSIFIPEEAAVGNESGNEAAKDLDLLVSFLLQVNLADHSDTWSWDYDSEALFSVKSAKSFLRGKPDYGSKYDFICEKASAESKKSKLDSEIVHISRPFCSVQ
ncbi:hypothetical protein L1987_75015 [Smallanthus sonchifolius]|uniref:Uncharacterized protein n=1 Tax=Smallanthus sonchifolius TaxID=185202 RepID=A0ACB9A5I0_9ASTR|nr:hypothetical protein L1987_75015 [Smallanthus sonchifolius]